jgi:hypothetical protein
VTAGRKDANRTRLIVAIMRYRFLDRPGWARPDPGDVRLRARAGLSTHLPSRLGGFDEKADRSKVDAKYRYGMLRH